MQGKELSWHQVPCPRDPILLCMKQAGRGCSCANVTLSILVLVVTWPGPSVALVAILILASDPISPSRCFPIVQLLSPSWSCDSPGSWARPHLGTHPRPTPPPHQLRPPPPRPGLLYPAPRPGPRSAGLQCHQARLGRGFSEKVFISTAPCRAAPRQHQLSRAAATATCNKYTATSSRNTQLHLILLHGDIHQYLVH